MFESKEQPKYFKKIYIVARLSNSKVISWENYIQFKNTPDFSGWNNSRFSYKIGMKNKGIENLKKLILMMHQLIKN